MHLIKNMPMKYRLLIIVFLPAIFLIWSVWGEYQATKEEAKIQTSMVLAEKLAFLAGNMETVSGLSKVHLITKDNSISRELMEYRAKVDSGIADLRDYSLKAISEGILEKDYFQPIFSKAETFHQINVQVDNRTIGYNELDSFYDSAIETLINSQKGLFDRFAGGDSMRSLFQLVILMEESLSAGQERSIIFQALIEDKISRNDYSDLLNLIGEQKAYKTVFFEVSLPVVEQIYESIVRSDVISEAEKIRGIVVANGVAGKFGISPQEWWQKQTTKINLFHDVEKKLITFLSEKFENQLREDRLDLLVHLAIVLGTLFISFLLIYLNMRSLAKKLQEEINVLSSSGEEIGKSITETASGTSETAAAVSETTTTVEELKQTAQVATEKAKNVAEVSDEAIKTLKKSEASVQATIQGMNSIQDGMGLISESIIKLSEHGQMIREIIDTVNDLAEQSHILAVNAAIESAKAGDQGKGFAVVAQEVRSLAEQSKQATIQVRNILNDIQNATSSAVMATDKGSKAVANGLTLSMETNESIRFLSLGINKVAQAASQIALSSQQQLVGVDQLTIAMSNIKIASNQQVNNMNQIETGIHGMNAVGRSLKQVILECKM